jgi:hypothetical protein
MSDLTFQIHGGDSKEVQALKQLAERELKALIADTVLYAEAAIVQKIDEYEAVDKGRLKGSITSKTAFSSGDSATKIRPGGLEAVVGTNVQYAIPVHDGYTRTLKGRKVRSAYGVHRGKFTQARVRQAERNSKRQGSLKISGASYSRDGETGDITMYVQGRPFVRDAIPEIEEHFNREAKIRLGGLGGYRA